jgi:hypothetical protein
VHGELVYIDSGCNVERKKVTEMRGASCQARERDEGGDEEG